MKKNCNILLSTILALSLLLPTGCKPSKEDSTQKTKIKKEISSETFAKEKRLLKDRGVNSVEAITRALELKPQRSYEDFIDLGTCYLWLGDFSRAAESYEIAAQTATTSLKLCGALYNKASALAYVDMKFAQKAIDLACKIQPESIEIARLRFALHRKGSDQLGLLVAADHLSRLDPNTTGHEVIGLIEGGIIIIAIISATTVSVVALTPPEDRAKVVPQIMNGYFSTVIKIRSSPTFGGMLMEMEE